MVHKGEKWRGACVLEWEREEIPTSGEGGRDQCSSMGGSDSQVGEGGGDEASYRLARIGQDWSVMAHNRESQARGGG